MNKIIGYFVDNWKRMLVTFLTLSGIGTALFCIVYYSLGATMQAECNAAAVAFAVTFAAFAFNLLSRFGAFDTIAYGGSMFISMFSYKQEKKYDDLVQYRDVKNAKRLKSYSYIVYGFVAFIFLVVLIAFEIKFNIAIQQILFAIK